MKIVRDEDGSLYALFNDYEEADEFEDFLIEEKDIECVMYCKDDSVRVSLLEEVPVSQATELLEEFKQRVEQRSTGNK